MHWIHHQYSKHYNKFSDLPIWDMLFDSFENPKRVDFKCGFNPEKKKEIFDMRAFKNVNEAYNSIKTN